VIPAPVETEMLEEVTFEMVALQVGDVVDAVLFLDGLHPRVVVPEIFMYANPEGPLAPPPLLPPAAQAKQLPPAAQAKQLPPAAQAKQLPPAAQAKQLPPAAKARQS
jgi:hypothetical protein